MVNMFLRHLKYLNGMILCILLNAIKQNLNPKIEHEIERILFLA